MSKTSIVILVAALLAASALAQKSHLHVRVDAFGYRSFGVKVAVLRTPLVGYDTPAPYTPSATLQVRRAADGTVAWSGSAVPWKGGATHTTSGDRAWWLDFTALVEPGDYYVFDPAAGISSEVFGIGDDVYQPVLRAAVRMYLHQRCGVAKGAAFVGAPYADAPCHVGSQQDTQCRSVSNPVASTAKDLSGGWHDAGDYNKYVNYADDAVHDLLAAYRNDPSVWRDDWDLPESGNGVADLLDEVAVELRWLLKMQKTDGSLLHKVSVTNFNAGSPPSSDSTPRFYAPATASATISGCGVFAHGALAFAALGDSASQAFAVELRQAALTAWAWLVANPGQIPSHYDNQGFVNAAAEDAPEEQVANRLRAAAYLFDLTGDGAVRAWFDANYPASHLIQWGWASPYEEGYLAALLHYAALPGATPSVATQIRATFTASVSGGSHLAHVTAGDDAYRAWLADADHVWGSNRVKCHEGLLFDLMRQHGLDPAHQAQYAAAAEGYLHYIHGVNPTGLTYLTHMDALGAPSSLRETYHAWFDHGTVFDNADTSLYGPPPGYLSGGVNQYYSPDAAYSGPPIAPPQNQPILKSYRDWNTGWPENSWQVSECHIPYQAAYVNLLSRHACSAFVDLGGALAGAGGAPRLLGGGSLVGNEPAGIFLQQAAPASTAALFLSTQSIPVALLGGVLVPNPPIGPIVLSTGAGGGFGLVAPLPVGLPAGVAIYLQCLIVDAGAPAGVAFSNALRGTLAGG